MIPATTCLNTSDFWVALCFIKPSFFIKTYILNFGISFKRVFTSLNCINRCNILNTAIVGQSLRGETCLLHFLLRFEILYFNCLIYSCNLSVQSWGSLNDAQGDCEATVILPCLLAWLANFIQNHSWPLAIFFTRYIPKHYFKAVFVYICVKVVKTFNFF